jgi:phenylacetate-CoA ligase
VRSLRLAQDRHLLRDWLLDQRNIPSMDAAAAVDEALAFLRGASPPLITGTPSALFNLARQMRARGVSKPLAAFARVGGEQLFPFQRAAIERFVARRAIDSYGATEIGALAGECPAGSMHVYSDHVHLEVFHGDTPADAGEFGDIVATALHNPAMPLIRYRVGDRGRLSPERCRCGLPQPVLLDLQARRQDVFAAADGSVHHGAELVARLDSLFDEPEADPVRQVQFVQFDPLHWEVMVEAPGLSAGGAGEDPVRSVVEGCLLALVRSVFGAECRVTVRYVDSLPRRAGKFRYYRTEPASR